MQLRGKVITFLVLTTLMTVSVWSPPALAAPTINIDGRELNFDTPPVIEDWRTLVPLRAIFETLGATVTWIDHSRTAVAIKDDTMVTIQVDATEPYINGIVKPIDVPARIIEGRIYAPLRFAVEAFGGSADWDPSTQTITLHPYPAGIPVGMHRFNPVPMGQAYNTRDGFAVTVQDMAEGDAAWEILEDPALLNARPADDKKYVIVTCTVTRIAASTYPQPTSDADFELIGSSNQTVKPFDKTVAQPEEGKYRELRALLQQGESITGSLVFYLPSSEANLVMVWCPFGSDRVYFEVRQNSNWLEANMDDR